MPTGELVNCLEEIIEYICTGRTVRNYHGQETFLEKYKHNFI